MTIQDHTESCISIMIIELDQHSIILDKLWMKKHDVNYHDHDDSISFHFDHCNHFEASKRSFSKQSIKKKDFFSKRIFFNQSKLIKNKEIKIFLEKINNSSKTIFKKATSIEKIKWTFWKINWTSNKQVVKKKVKKDKNLIVENSEKRVEDKFVLWRNSTEIS
jgi:LmbE family N-acetylglucosaminyl deacetylase